MGTGEAVGAPLQGHTGPVRSVSVSPDGKYIVSGSDDKIIRVWDLGTGETVGSLRGHTGPIWSVSISPDSKHIVSGSEDKSIRVWDLDFLNQNQSSEAPAVCFSSNPIHALHSASSFLEGPETLAPSGPTEEGWVVGPEGRLLFWIPPTLHPVTYARDNTLVIPNNALQLDLSCVAHGTSWHMCRDQREEVAPCL
ncbi:WD40-repeat-containing domain protein [Suillus clintonianus]|uniref:WD40-repeat-containing domain protein n=1 Tax=Suillus clintonianus TaxID=1904413 RepID=UPI001B85B7D5|nr:WD40-repeat-containing domain protein [Suillus clintonianus]KAG2126823.1 WD40-repeat-containing domain protein [Suillus clintonianus]